MLTDAMAYLERMEYTLGEHLNFVRLSLRILLKPPFQDPLLECQLDIQPARLPLVAAKVFLPSLILPPIYHG